VILVVGYVLFGWMFYRYQSTDCKERGKAYGIRVERLKRDARTTLRIGTHQEDVIRFFQENGLPVSFDKGLSEYEGTIYTKGCGPAGCGSDTLFSVCALRWIVPAQLSANQLWVRFIRTACRCKIE
jgi:hypothetical protein